MGIRNSYTDLLIIGAGPAGLMAACWASQYPIKTRIIDKKSERTRAGHADGINSRTMEIFDSFGIADLIMRQAVRIVEASYWGPDGKSGDIHRIKRQRSQPQKLSRFEQMLLNQGGIEQILIDYLKAKGRVHVERNRKADGLDPDGCCESECHDEFPVRVRIVSVKDEGKNELDCLSDDNTEVVHARYVIACDGARSWTQKQLQIPFDVWKTESTWGVMDIVPITDFPDIRHASAIRSSDGGSIMVVPRENGLVRFYLHINGGEGLNQDAEKESENSLNTLIQTAQKTLKPYRLTCKYCDWWSMYPIGRRLIKQYQSGRIFFAGDAAHTHSPKGGQGMNISMQDTYNLVWKLAEVIMGALDPAILETYHSERRPQAEELMRFDTRLVYAYEEGSMQDDSKVDVESVRSQYAGFMAGVAVTYPPSILVGECQSDKSLAWNIQVGKRLPSYLVVGQADGCPIHLAEKLRSNGSWRLLVFSGDLHCVSGLNRLSFFANEFSDRFHEIIKRSNKDCHLFETLLIHSSSRASINLLDLPDVFHQFDDDLGWDYSKVFADDPSYDGNSGEIYEHYGIDKQKGCLVVCRPDQHVGWVGDIEDVEGLERYFSRFLLRKTKPQV
ncbi:FAD binding domain-containing protein [Aspergillus alliaceus]|uniref:FAD binding domain-containing protein n=1 Tax=Petromyces alliaceus TaxID=209559 RepID=A0A5N7C7H4_PETAA|nr:FAD binding domain-containing protein [Aspergillus alliaceus]